MGMGMGVDEGSGGGAAVKSRHGAHGRSFESVDNINVDLSLRPIPQIKKRSHHHAAGKHVHKHNHTHAQMARRASSLDSTLVGIFIFQALIFTYFITCNELYVARNPTDHEDGVWGFGQVRLFLLLLSLYS